jgi:hypothetical protein
MLPPMDIYKKFLILHTNIKERNEKTITTNMLIKTDFLGFFDELMKSKI